MVGRDENAGLSEGEGGGVDGRASRREPVTESLRVHQITAMLELTHEACSLS